VEQAATLGELNTWLEDQKTTRRFWIVSFLLGILSLVVLYLKANNTIQ
jgi:hypothetical protein